jgi:plastocyanin
MKKIFTLISIILIIIILVSCKKSEPVVTDETTEVTGENVPEETLEEIGVIEQITETDTEESNVTLDQEEPEKPDEDLENVTPIAIITIDDLEFIPKEINVSLGTNVIWQHRDEYGSKDWIKHVLTIYPPEGPGFASQPMFLGDDFNATVTKIGRYRYISVPYKNRMQGYINVY